MIDQGRVKISEFIYINQLLWNKNILEQLTIVVKTFPFFHILFSSFIQTILSASEFHRIIPYGSWALPPVEIFTLP